jgi:Secretion system C-terminal sorting domain
MAVLKTNVVFLFAFVVGLNVSAQTITNGNFNSGSSGWGCNPEAYNPESTYGGSSNSNIVAEVDEEVGLCQTVSGFTVGSYYSISFKASRRTTCGPTFQSVKLKVNNGALTANISRNGGGFNWGIETFYFVATSTTHTITFTSNTTGTCNLVFDNISLNLISALPIELVDFSALLKNDRTVELAWQTASEKDNDYFTIERSIDGENWTAIQEIDGAGNSTNLLNYATTDIVSEKGIFYYRLKQTDFDGAYTYSDIRAVVVNQLAIETSVYPNPTNGSFTLTYSEEKDAPALYTTMGTEAVEYNVIPTNGGFIYDISTLANGIYFLKTTTETIKVVKH